MIAIPQATADLYIQKLKNSRKFTKIEWIRIDIYYFLEKIHEIQFFDSLWNILETEILGY